MRMMQPWLLAGVLCGIPVMSALNVKAAESGGARSGAEDKSRVTGVVKRPDGTSAAGLPVLVVGGFMQRDKAETTDAEGRFDVEWNPARFGGLEHTFVLVVRDADRNLAVARELEEDTRTFVLVLEPGVTLAGRAESEGKPLANPTAMLIFWTGNRGMHLDGVAREVDDPGRFEIPALPAGRRYWVSVSAPGYGQRQVRLDEEETMPGRVELDPVELQPANLKLAGQVLDADDQPVEGAQVSLHGEGQPSGNTRTDAEGRFSFDAVCEGPLRLSAFARNAHGNVMAKGGDTNVVLRLGATASMHAGAKSHKVTGTVTGPEGKPAAGVRLTSFPMTGGRWIKSGADGSFSLNWQLEPWQAERGRSALLVAMDSARNLAAAFTLEEDTPALDVQLQPGLVLAGRVETPEGEPIAGAAAGAWILAGNTYTSVTEESIVTGADGSFEMRALPAGQQYIVFASAKGRGRAQKQVETDFEEQRMEIEPFVLSVADQIIAGQVLDARERPVSGANVSVSGEGQPQENVTTDREGRFSARVCEGTVRLFVHAQGGYANTSVTAGETNIVVQLGQGSSPARETTPRRASLKGKLLPDLAALGLPPETGKAGQRILLCLMDVEQRPSRRVARLLAEQHAILQQKGLVVLAAQADVISEAVIEAWKQTGAVPYPVGRLTEKSPGTAWVSGVSSLPWLILTDAKGKVAAEGFPFEDLEAQLNETSP